MGRPPIKRTAEGLTVTLYQDAWPRPLQIDCEWPRGELRLHGTEQIRALHYMLGEILAADPQPDDRPSLPAIP